MGLRISKKGAGLHVQFESATYARYTMSMSMSKVHSSGSSEHSTPLSSNKERPVGNSNLNVQDAQLMRSLSVLDNIDNNEQLSARQPPSPTVSRGLISYSMSSFLRICVVVKSRNVANHLVKPPPLQLLHQRTRGVCPSHFYGNAKTKIRRNSNRDVHLLLNRWLAMVLKSETLRTKATCPRFPQYPESANS